MRILAVMAHPDDAEAWAAGTIINHTRRGDAVLICCLTYPADSRRAAEARAGAAVMGAQIEFLGLADNGVFDEPETARRVTEMMRGFRPEVVLTHWVDDFHLDHAAAFRLAQRAVNAIRGTEAWPYHMFASDVSRSRGIRGGFEPDTYIDVSDAWEEKARALLCHESQGPEGMVKSIGRRNAFYGARANVAYAEVFRKIGLYGQVEARDFLIE